MMLRSQLLPDTDPPKKESLMYIAPPLIPVSVKTERKGTDFTINLYANGELFDYERYVSDTDGFALAEAGGDQFSPPIPILLFPLKVGGTGWTWQGQISSEGETYSAQGSVAVTDDNLTIGQGSVEAVRSDVAIDLTKGGHRKLSFWFQPGKGLLKRQFGASSIREPVNP